MIRNVIYLELKENKKSLHWNSNEGFFILSIDCRLMTID